MARGGFTAVVDLASGQVTKLGVQTSLSYYNPGCGVGETAVLTQSPGEDKTATRLLRLDTESGTVSAPIEASGQLTSAVPTKDGSIVAAEGAEIVKVASTTAHAPPSHAPTPCRTASHPTVTAALSSSTRSTAPEAPHSPVPQMPRPLRLR